VIARRTRDSRAISNSPSLRSDRAIAFARGVACAQRAPPSDQPTLFSGGIVITKSTRAAIVLCLLSSLLPSTARADDATRIAMDHFRRGTRAYDLGHFLEAAAEYEKAYETKESPALLYNLGQAYRGAGEHQKALNAYRAYLRNQPDASNREEVTRFIEALRHTIEVQKATTEKPPVGTLPAPNTPASNSTTTVTTPTPPPVAIVAPPPKPREPDLHELAVGKKLRIAGIAAGAVGIGSLVAGGVFAGYTASVNHTLNNPPPTMPTYNKALESRGRTDQALETAFFVIGGAAVAASVATLVIGTQKVKRNSFALAPVAGPGRVGASLSVSF
jgi:tetratricopeptide (TPR) repeat protein